MSDQAVLEHRVEVLERAFQDQVAALQGINSSLKALTQLEAHHTQTKADLARAFDDLKAQEGRLRAIELEVPATKLVVKNVIAGVIGLAALAGAAAVKTLFGW